MIDDELLHKWIDDQLTKEELEIFKQRPEYESLVALYKSTDDFVSPNVNLEDVLDGILKQSKTSSPIKKEGKVRSLSTFFKYGIAASVLLLATLFLWPKGGEQVFYEVAKGEQKEAILPDQSKVVLYAESQLVYDKQNWANARLLELKGEAFFDVQKGSTFTVKTDNGSIKVLGTKFNVWSRKGILEVKCHSGKVAVLSPSGKVVDELLPAQALRMKGGAIAEKWQIATKGKSSWLEGKSRFKKVTLARVMEEVERQFKVKVIIARDVNTTEVFSCHFQHEDLEEALKTILTPLKIKYELKDNSIVNLLKE